MPDSMFISVVFPEPFSPRSARISPFSRVRLIFLFAATEPKLFDIPLSSMALPMISPCLLGAVYLSYAFDVIVHGTLDDTVINGSSACLNDGCTCVVDKCSIRLSYGNRSLLA